MNKKLALLLALSTCVLSFLSAQTSAGELETIFEKGIFTYESDSIQYRYTAVNPSTNGEACLIIFLHGHSANGSDNAAQLTKKPVSAIYDYLRENGTHGFVLAPQRSAEKNAFDLPELAALIRSFAVEHGISTSRIYLTGVSQGCVDTWNLLLTAPDLFRAAIAVSGTPRLTADDIQKIKNIPIYMFAGEKEDKRKLKELPALKKRINAAGGSASYAVVENADHVTACENAINAESLNWLFAQ